MYKIPRNQIIVATMIASIIGVNSFLLTPTAAETVSVTLEPGGGTRAVGDTFVTTLNIKSSIPVNVFKGVLEFDHHMLTVASINYNTSIADLWAEEPWYSNGAGTINFTGGTTMPGGFTGEGTLITVTFKAKDPGIAVVTLKDMHVLQHDGLGTEAPVSTPIDGIFSIEPTRLAERTVLKKDITGPLVTVVPQRKSTDLNNDGKQSLADISIFMADLVTKNLRSDFNGDGNVTLEDLSILTQA